MSVTPTAALPGLGDRSAVVSPCGTYRYELRRQWAKGLVCTWIMLNPSVADSEIDDPTIRRCAGFARRWGHSGITVRNLFALRATDPRALRHHPDPVGPDNDWWLTAPASPGLTVCAWGTHGALRDRAARVVAVLTRRGAPLHCLALTAQGHPRHPLYLHGALRPRPYPNHDPEGDPEGDPR